MLSRRLCFPLVRTHSSFKFQTVYIHQQPPQFLTMRDLAIQLWGIKIFGINTGTYSPSIITQRTQLNFTLIQSN